VEAHPLTPRQVEQRQAAGALVVDVRTALQFDEAHLPDSVSIPAVQAGFGTKLSWLTGSGQEVILIGRDDEDGARAAHLAAAVGITRIGGFLAGGMTSWREEKRGTGRIERIDVAALHERVERDPALQLLDVREQGEWDEEHIPGSTFTPYHDLHRIPEGIDPQQPVAVICSSGQRSGVAASLLARHGARAVLHVVDGGVGTWGRRGWPVERPQGAASR
jgi:rhodanese-related sulfurtransferase